MNWEDWFTILIFTGLLYLTWKLCVMASYVIEWIVNYFTKEH
jgi:hypothetical protein